MYFQLEYIAYWSWVSHGLISAMLPLHGQSCSLESTTGCRVTIFCKSVSFSHPLNLNNHLYCNPTIFVSTLQHVPLKCWYKPTGLHNVKPEDHSLAWESQFAVSVTSKIVDWNLLLLPYSIFFESQMWLVTGDTDCIIDDSRMIDEWWLGNGLSLIKVLS